MFLTYQNPVYDYLKSSDHNADVIAHHPLIIVGAGPVGMAAGLDASAQGIKAVILDDNNTVSVGSRAVCYSKRALEILNRLKCGKRMVDKGVTWQVGKVFFQDKLVSSFNLLPEEGHEQPAFINLQQYYLEEFMVDELQKTEHVDLRWKNRVISVEQNDSLVTVTVDTPDGPYQMTTDWLIVADGANSPVRNMLGLEMKGKVFKDRFLIADIVMKADFPPERWFSFDPSYHRGQSTLLHRQPNDVWRLDFQLGWDKDPEEEKKPENIIPRVKAMLGDDVEFELEWASVYTFMCRRMDRFREKRVIFAGDAAHQVSPFGARGANSGFQDTDNLLWKLNLVMDKKAPESLIDSYCQEREFAADENLLNSTRATDFITPKSNVSKMFRNETLELSHDFPFAQKLVNSGRLSDPAYLTSSPLNSSDDKSFTGTMIPGAVMDDAPVILIEESHWLLNLFGNQFGLFLYVDDPNSLSQDAVKHLQELSNLPIPIQPLLITNNKSNSSVLPFAVAEDRQGLIRKRYDAKNGTCYLIRPDQHIAARWRTFDKNLAISALNKATGNV